MIHDLLKEISLGDWMVVSSEILISLVITTELLNLYISILEKEKARGENIKFSISRNQEE